MQAVLFSDKSTLFISQTSLDSFLNNKNSKSYLTIKMYVYTECYKRVSSGHSNLQSKFLLITKGTPFLFSLISDTLEKLCNVSEIRCDVGDSVFHQLLQ